MTSERIEREPMMIDIARLEARVGRPENAEPGRRAAGAVAERLRAAPAPAGAEASKVAIDHLVVEWEGTPEVETADAAARAILDHLRRIEEA
jgi:hypothetical protein